jgi:hypothetical protein
MPRLLPRSVQWILNVERHSRGRGQLIFKYLKARSVSRARAPSSAPFVYFAQLAQPTLLQHASLRRVPVLRKVQTTSPCIIAPPIDFPVGSWIARSFDRSIVIFEFGFRTASKSHCTSTLHSGATRRPNPRSASYITRIAERDFTRGPPCARALTDACKDDALERRKCVYYASAASRYEIIE